MKQIKNHGLNMHDKINLKLFLSKSKHAHILDVNPYYNLFEFDIIKLGVKITNQFFIPCN